MQAVLSPKSVEGGFTFEKYFSLHKMSYPQNINPNLLEDKTDPSAILAACIKYIKMDFLDL